MPLTLFYADCSGNPANCIYPNKAEVSNAKDMETVVSHDHVCASYQNNSRNRLH